ncbi:phosphate/phosphite/phosphonate ABC transporter substrate-binding protein [Tateyamaria sp.]|uniref:phosphate/phosphite/phosphonate ABC transporter substrate-binding protein n=1 Tax=Tateyamaria sp. TaxID=1929288 RepID=UPI003B214EEC
MIASLGMYAMPHAHGATDRFWTAIRDALGYGPKRLDQSGDLWAQWLSPDLLLSQACGLPFRARLHDKTSLVATPDFGLPGCPPGHYNSVLLVRHSNPATCLADLDRPRLAYNEALSQSGWAAPFAHFRVHGRMFQTGPQTGAHAVSARAVAHGAADIAALDALTWKMLQREDPELTCRLKEIGRTDPTPGLPYITALAHDPEPIATAIATAIAQLNVADRDTLQLKGVVRIPAADYLALPVPPLP